jgi:hypothetical protein
VVNMVNLNGDYALRFDLGVLFRSILDRIVMRLGSFRFL